jgi:hypothetical protein
VLAGRRVEAEAGAGELKRKPLLEPRKSVLYLRRRLAGRQGDVLAGGEVEDVVVGRPDVEDEGETSARLIP